MGDWIAERLRGRGAHQASTAELYASWRRRAESLGIDTGNARDLGERLRASDSNQSAPASRADGRG